MHDLLFHPNLLHPLTGQPLQAVGVVNGRTIWPIMGGDGTDADANDGASDDGATDGAEDSGDVADKADDTANRMLIDERTGRKAAESLLAELTGKSKSEIRRLLKDPTSAREAFAAKSDDGDAGSEPVDADKIRREAEQAATEKANARLVRAEVRALAAESFTNPTDALHNLNLDEFEVDEDGELEDAAAVKKALADVLAKNPHYAKKGAGPRPDPSQGPRGNAKSDPGPGMPRLRQAYANTSK